MTSEEFEKLIDKEKYQVFLVVCPTPIPINFAIHPWFVLNKKGSLSRWEVAHWDEYKGRTHFGHIYKDILPPFQGLEKIITRKRTFAFLGYWKPRILEQWEGDVAKQMAELIESSPTKYQYCNEYRLLGPNSNTYIQWVLNKFPELNIKLPWNCVGKNYRK